MQWAMWDHFDFVRVTYSLKRLLLLHVALYLQLM
jgi:hypothetical protein